MAITRKLNKLRRDPQAFFADSGNSLVASIGAMVYRSSGAPAARASHKPPRVAKPVDIAAPTRTPARPAATALANKSTVPPKPAPKREIDEVKFLAAAYADDAAPDLWRFYRHVEATSSINPTVAIYPLGVPFIDLARRKSLESHGLSTVFLPLWSHVEAARDLDDLEYKANAAPLLADGIARTLIDSAIAKSAQAILLPYDATALSRAIAIRARGMGLRTLCDVDSLPLSRKFYGAEGKAAFPICDYLAVNGDPAAFMSPTAGRRHRLVDLAGLRSESRPADSRTNSLANSLADERLRTGLGIGACDAIRVFMLPPLQLSFSGTVIDAAVMPALSELLDRMQPTDHLVLVSKRRKAGLLPQAAVALLASQYRKSVWLYHEHDDIECLLSLAQEVVLPAGMPHFIDSHGQKVQRYDLDPATASTQIHLAEAATTQATPDCVTVHQALNDPLRLPFSHAGHGLADDVLARILDPRGPGLDMIAVPDPTTNLPITEGRQKHLLRLLNANRRSYGAASLRDANQAEAFVQWGAEPSEAKARPEVMRSHFARPRLYLEDGFIRSKGLWTNPDEPTLSVVMDTRAIYYDAMRPSLLETTLDSDLELTTAEQERAGSLIQAIVHNRISKYNHAPVLDLDFRASGKRVILLVDQKAGDMSIKYGAATDDTFADMLQQALALDDVEIVIKQHPCAISGSPAEAHYTAESLGEAARRDNVHLIGFDVNPYSLIQAVDEVWVVSSGMGFEALMAGKQVRCFGVPFYAGWGLTIDAIKPPRRRRSRTVEDVFHVFYLLLSRYVDPDTGEPCEVERLVQYFSGSAPTEGQP